jgi:uncharacterized protein (UPF0276 family)
MARAASPCDLGDGLVAGAPIPARAGIGLRFPHHATVIQDRPEIAWLEVHPENYLGAGSALDDLLAIRRDYPVSLHATGLSLGSADGIDPEHLAALRSLTDQIEPALVSDHLSWSIAGGAYLPDLLPLPYTEEALCVVAENVERAQAALRRPLLIENPSTYLAFASSEMGEAAFLGELAQRTGCGVLLDVNNVFVSACNLGDDPIARLDELIDAVGAAAIGEIHLAGHATQIVEGGAVLRIDDHGSAVCEAVWSLFRWAVGRLGPRPSLVEWDTNIPALSVLQEQARLADIILDEQDASRARAG